MEVPACDPQIDLIGSCTRVPSRFWWLLVFDRNTWQHLDLKPWKGIDRPPRGVVFGGAWARARRERPYGVVGRPTGCGTGGVGRVAPGLEGHGSPGLPRRPAPANGSAMGAPMRGIQRAPIATRATGAHAPIEALDRRCVRSPKPCAPMAFKYAVAYWLNPKDGETVPAWFSGADRLVRAFYTEGERGTTLPAWMHHDDYFVALRRWFAGVLGVDATIERQEGPQATPRVTPAKGSCARARHGPIGCGYQSAGYQCVAARGARALLSFAVGRSESDPERAPRRTLRSTPV